MHSPRCSTSHWHKHKHSPGYIAQALSGIALASDPADSDRAAQLRGAIAQLNEDADIATNAYSGPADQLERHFEQTLVLALGAAAWKQFETAGKALTLEEAIAAARSLCEATRHPVADV